VLVVSDATGAAASAEAWALGISQSCGMLRLIGKPEGLSPHETSVVAVAGIANPERFVASLKSEGWNVVDSLTFKDHHRYSMSDVAAISAKVQGTGATAVFTTDKDAVRFEALGALPFALYRVPLRVEFDPADALFGSIKAVLN
jgi:tetraacyldisaccharide-1-P 4'-kinase